MEHKTSQDSKLVSMPFFGFLYRKINNVYHLVFFIIGLSLGIAAILCFNSLTYSLQAFLYPATTPITKLLPPPLSVTLPLSPSLNVFSSSTWNTKSNFKSTELKTSLMHNMTDQELFLKVSMASGIQDFPKAIPKVAFMFLAKGELPLATLWGKFFKGHDGFYSIYLHQHPFSNVTVPKDSVFYGRNVPSQVSLLLLIFISLQPQQMQSVFRA